MTEQKKTPEQNQQDSSQIPQGYFIPMQPPEAEDEINILDLWRVLARSKRLIAIIVFISVAISIISALVMTPIYRADVLLAPTASERGGKNQFGSLVGQFGGLANLAGISIPGGGNIETAIATLKSRQFITGFISDQNLKPILFEDSWDIDNKEWLVKSPSIISRVKGALLSPEKSVVSNHESLAPGEPSAWEAYKRLKESFSVNSDAKTGLVTVHVDWVDPNIAAQWANALVNRLNNELRQQAIQESEKSIRYLQKQIQETSVTDLRTVLYRLIEEHTKNMTLAKVNEQYALKVIDPAIQPEERIKPKRTFIVILGFLLGLMAGIFIAFIRNFIRQQHAGQPDAAAIDQELDNAKKTA